MEYTMQVYNDKSIKALICCVCACVRVDTGGVRSQIEFRSGSWFFKLPRGSLKKNSMNIFAQRYRQPGSPLAFVGKSHRNPNFEDWQLCLHPEVCNISCATARSAGKAYQTMCRNSRAKHCCVVQKTMSAKTIALRRSCSADSASCQYADIAKSHCLRMRWSRLDYAMIIGTGT